MVIFVFLGNRLAEWRDNRRCGLGLETQHPENLLLEKAEKDINPADPAQQQLKDHAS
jgi:hypothetical protein